jgi:M3 family oligoendopeptidase
VRSRKFIDRSEAQMASDSEIRFDEMQVSEPVFEQVASEYAAFHERLDAADSADAWLQVVWDWNELRRTISTWQSVVEIHFTQDTRNKAARDALDRRDAMAPKLTELAVGMIRRLIASPERGELEEKLGHTAFLLWECEVTTFEPAIKDDLVNESRLDSEYTELVASARLDYRGRQYTLSELAKFAEDPNREVRHETAQIRWGWYLEAQQQLDKLYHDLVALRHRMAAKLGFESFTQLGYRRMRRIDYGPAEVERFRAQVREHVVPLCVELCRQQANRLGLDSLMQWDEAVHDAAGNPAPLGQHDWMLDRAEEMFAEMNDEMAGLFRTMRKRQLLDLQSRDGKAPGGYCSGVASLRLPFIYANFNGTKGDVEVFTHEMGHAFQWYASQAIELVDYHWPTSELCEIHSMGLEYLTWPAMDKFFGADAERFRRQHLTGALLFMPYGVAVDHFQHLVYAEPKATPAERAAMWQEMERTYLPWRDWGDLKHPASGRRWQAQQHIYGGPFYYIDYTLALTCALQLWTIATADRDAALQIYLQLCRGGGTLPFRSMLERAGLHSPFDDGCLENVVKNADAVLKM